MAPIISNIRRSSGLGILAERSAKSPSLELHKNVLIYGFNGSGKSTLSRIFASLHLGEKQASLPSDAVFEIELDDSSKLSCPNKLTGLESRILVFNTDFIESNLQWSAKKAKPVFYIGKEQANAAAELDRRKGDLKTAESRKILTEKAVADADKSIRAFRRERAKLIADYLNLRNRKYEAPQLINDYENFTLSDDCSLTDQQISDFTAACRADEPMPRLSEVVRDTTYWRMAVVDAHTICETSPAQASLAEIKDHPTMADWIKTGHQYHTEKHLNDCLFCGNGLSTDRIEQLSKALDDSFSKFMWHLDDRTENIEKLIIDLNALSTAALICPL